MIGTQQSAIYDLHYLFFAYSDFRPFPERLGGEAAINELIGSRHKMQ